MQRGSNREWRSIFLQKGGESFEKFIRDQVEIGNALRHSRNGSIAPLFCLLLLVMELKQKADLGHHEARDTNLTNEPTNQAADHRSRDCLVFEKELRLDVKNSMEPEPGERE